MQIKTSSLFLPGATGLSALMGFLEKLQNLWTCLERA